MNTGELLREFNARAGMAGLTVECPSFGNINADIAIVGDFPGERELYQKMPFCGGAGKLLFDVLAKQSITRQHVYTTNVVRRRVVEEKGKKAHVSKGELEQWAGLLEWELSQLPSLKYVLVLGSYALTALTGETGITHWRGSLVEWQLRAVNAAPKTVTLVIANNPALVLREPKNELIFHFDLNKLKLAREGKWRKYEIDAIINPSPAQAIAFIDRLQDERQPISFDIETISHETACVGFANDPHQGMCVNFRDRTQNLFSMAEERSVRLRIQKLLADRTQRFVAQNGTFDTYWLWYKDRIRTHSIWFDTLLAHHTLYPALPHSLGFLTSQYTTHPYYKDEKRDWREGGNIDGFWEYNVKDACITLACQRALAGELQAQNLEQFFFKHVMRLQPHLVNMTVGGVLCDAPMKQKIMEELGEQVAEQERTFKHLAAIAANDPTLDVNPRSPKQLSELFFRRLSLVGRGTSTDEENRKRIVAHPRTSDNAKAVIAALDKYAEDNKFLSTYASSRIDEDLRIRCEYKQFGVEAAPGRLSSAQVMWGSGMNLQNQTERSKAMFLADPGYRFLYFDLAQAEARVVAYAWKVEALRANFEAAAGNKSFDVHRANASRIFQVPYDTIPKEDWYVLGVNTDDPKMVGKPTRRYLGKRCVHGLNYRMGIDRLAATCNISMTMASEAYHSYHRAFPEIRSGWDATVKEVYRTRELWSFMGRRLRFLGRLPAPDAQPGSDEAKILESIIAFKPQSTIGDKVCQTIYMCEDDPDWPKKEARMALNVHDALIALVPDDDDLATHVAKIMHKHATSPILIHGTPVSIPADFAQSVEDDTGHKRWSTLKKFKLEAAHVL